MIRVLVDGGAGLAGWQKPVLTLFSAAFAGGAMGPDRILAHLPGARGQDHALLLAANFYLTEDQGPELARRIAVFAAASERDAGLAA